MRHQGGPLAPAPARAMPARIMPGLHFPATARNRVPLLDALRPRLSAGVVLEIASGSGEHGVFFAQHLPHVIWQPTDADPAHLASIEAWRLELGGPNVRPALRLDTRGQWPTGPFAAVFCANLVHIAPWPVAQALFAGAASVLPPGCPLFTYGPYLRGGAHTAPSNAAFDASLRSRDPCWGVRDIDDLAAIAPGFAVEDVLPMPANNFTIVWRRRG